MLFDPSGASMGLPTDLLDGLPISNFVLPGLFLIIVMGIIPLILAYVLRKRTRWAWLGTLVQGIVLLLWIGFQWILWGDDEPDLIQVGEFQHIVGDGQVTDMDGIERTEK